LPGTEPEVGLLERGDLLPEGGEHELPRRAALPARAGSGRLAQAGGQHPAHLGRRCGGPGTGGDELLPDRGQQLLVPADQLHLDLAPALHLSLLVRPGGEGRRGHRVVGDLGQGAAAVVPENRDHPAGPQGRHRPGPRTAEDPCHRREEALGRVLDRPPQWRVQLPAGRAGRQLEMPAFVGAADAAAQRDPGTQQPQVRGVVVDGIEVVLHRSIDRRDAGRPVERGQREGGVDVELPLDLELSGRHVRPSPLPGATCAGPPANLGARPGRHHGGRVRRAPSLR
jgi:hypothetical protein